MQDLYADLALLSIYACQKWPEYHQIEQNVVEEREVRKHQLLCGPNKIVVEFIMNEWNNEANVNLIFF